MNLNSLLIVKKYIQLNSFIKLEYLITLKEIYKNIFN